MKDPKEMTVKELKDTARNTKFNIDKTSFSPMDVLVLAVVQNKLAKRQTI